jgi:hypothetical protein
MEDAYVYGAALRSPQTDELREAWADGGDVAKRLLGLSSGSAPVLAFLPLDLSDEE